MSGHGDSGPRPELDTVCFTCAGLRKISVPRLYSVEGSGSVVGEWQACPQCGGEGRLRGLQPPV